MSEFQLGLLEGGIGIAVVLLIIAFIVWVDYLMDKKHGKE